MAGIILLAAGSGNRFIAAGGTGNKLNAVMTETAESSVTVFDATLAQTMASGMPVHVITRPDNLPVQASCARAKVPVTLAETCGTGDSLAAGVRDTPDWDGWLIHLADMPFVTSEIFITVADTLRHAAVVRPFWQNTPGHPVGFAPSLREKLLQLRGDDGARELLHGHEMLRLNFTDPAVIRDIDLPSQLSAYVSNGNMYATS
ncbi:nucleotidyltransferase family protein [Rahnella selenatireducens]|uniref:nucleotidyltransferase family protein n=1 Tax=Rahnella selenatireducens TaxID=3389797 RepID=UPI0039689115